MAVKSPDSKAIQPHCSPTPPPPPLPVTSGGSGLSGACTQPSRGLATLPVLNAPTAARQMWIINTLSTTSATRAQLEPGNGKFWTDTDHSSLATGWMRLVASNSASGARRAATRPFSAATAATVVLQNVSPAAYCQSVAAICTSIGSTTACKIEQMHLSGSSSYILSASISSTSLFRRERMHPSAASCFLKAGLFLASLQPRWSLRARLLKLLPRNLPQSRYHNVSPATAAKSFSLAEPAANQAPWR